MFSVSPERVALVSSPEELSSTCQTVDEAARQAGFDDRESYALQLAVCEAAENIFAHGYEPDSPGPIHITIESDPGRLTVILVDSAPPFNPARQDPGPPSPPDDPPAGGLGLFIMHKIMDEILYTREAGHNRLTLSKWVGGSEPE